MMPVIRNSAANSLNSLFNVVTTTADSANNAIASIGRLSAAGYAKADAYATDVEANAAAAKAVAVKSAALSIPVLESTAGFTAST